MVPAGTSAFWRASDSKIACGGMPSVGELAVGNVDEDLALLLAEHLDLVDVGDLEQPLAHVFGVVDDRLVARALAGQRVDRDIDVGIFVVEERPEHALRNVLPHVADLLAHLVPELLHVARRRRILEHDLHRREARPREGADLLEPGQRLQPGLDAVGDLPLHLLAPWPRARPPSPPSPSR